VAIIKTDIII